MEWVETKSGTINSLIESCQSRPRTSILLVHPVFARSHKSNAPQRITRRRSTGSGGEVCERVMGRPVGDADQQVRKDSGPLMGKSSPTRRSWEMTQVSLSQERPRRNAAEARAQMSAWRRGASCKLMVGSHTARSGGRLPIVSSQWPAPAGTCLALHIHLSAEVCLSAGV